jgi:molybdopterin/thiamine biosynthesis adenylyltransferase
MRFSDEEIRRYSRQMVLREVGGVGQERLRAATATAQSELEALYLAAAGVGTIAVPSAAIAEAARALNPLVRVEVIEAGDGAGEAALDAPALRALGAIREALWP